MTTTAERPIANFKDLRVWEEGIELIKEVYALCDYLPKDELHSLTSQMKRAAVSVPANIVEGFRRMSAKESLRF